MARRAELPDLELACMRILWEDGDLTVREVRERLHPQRSLAYTTIMTVLDRLARKGVVSRRKTGKAHLYHSEFPRSEARTRAVRRLLDIYFDGSEDALRAYLLGPVPVPVLTHSARPAVMDESLL